VGDSITADLPRDRPTDRAPTADVLAEGRRLAGMFDGARIRARLLGGVGIALHAHRQIVAPFRRTYGDLDYVVHRSDGAAFRRMLGANGYEANERFNAVHGAKRLLFFDPEHERQVDVFVGTFRMCHVLELNGRLTTPGPSLAPADLLLTKLQVVSLNEKDVVDSLMLLGEHEIGAGPEGVDPGRIAQILGHDWGWYTTVLDNLSKVTTHLNDLPDLEAEIRDRIRERLAVLQAFIDRAPKSLAWRSRSLIGRRLPWYELPEEVAT